VTTRRAQIGISSAGFRVEAGRFLFCRAGSKYADLLTILTLFVVTECRREPWSNKLYISLLHGCFRPSSFDHTGARPLSRFVKARHPFNCLSVAPSSAFSRASIRRLQQPSCTSFFSVSVPAWPCLPRKHLQCHRYSHSSPHSTSPFQASRPCTIHRNALQCISGARPAWHVATTANFTFAADNNSQQFRRTSGNLNIFDNQAH